MATFTFDSNPGPTRTGTLTIAGQFVTVTQAGSTYVAAQGLENLVNTKLRLRSAVAVDSAGNVFIADTGQNQIKEWNVATQTVTTLPFKHLNGPSAVAVDAAGNVYVADTGNNEVNEWHAATHKVTVLAGAKLLNSPAGVAVDGAGRVIVADTGNSVIRQWNPRTRKVTILVSGGLAAPNGVAVDGSRNLYIADIGKNAVKVRRWAFVSTTPIEDTAAAGAGALLPVLPTTTLLSGEFAPRSDQNWLTVDNVTGGVVSFSLTRNVGAARTAHLTLLGRRINVTQLAGS